MDSLRHYREVWCLDFEFHAPDGHRPQPLCLVARELRSGQLVRQWIDGSSQPPYSADADTLLVAFYASAEWGCHLALNWQMPVRVLDLFTEFRCLTNGRSVPHGVGLLGALAYYGLDAITAGEKDGGRELAIRGGPYAEVERVKLLEYCQSDVDSLARLLPVMLPSIDLPRALLRGRYTVAVARMEWNGVPIDTSHLKRLRDNWSPIRQQLTAEVNRHCGVYVPVDFDLDPQSEYGRAVYGTAEEFGIDPFVLAAAAAEIHEEERAHYHEVRDALTTARKETGLTLSKIAKLEDSGKDANSVRGLDVKARELAGRFPELEIGRGYESGAGPDEGGQAERLFNRLRKPDPQPRPRIETIREAAERLTEHGPDSVGTYSGPMKFSAARFADYLKRHGIAWPRLESGKLALDDETFREMARGHPDRIGPIREVRQTLGQLRLNDLAVGPDGRNRCLLSMFRSRTGRNQPSNSRFIFGPSCWLRSLIQPSEGRAIAYIDWSQQELAIAAALSGDVRMGEAFRSGDFYLTFAKMAGAVPQDATKQSHTRERDQFKTLALGVLYGLSGEGLARRLGEPNYRGRELLRLHQRTFTRFWEWSDSIEERALLTGKIRTPFGWTVHVGSEANPRSVRNFPMQAGGAEMMRLAACLATERGVGVCCPVHDAFLIEADTDTIEAEAGRMQSAMQEASELVLPGFPLRTDAKIVRHPDRYTDPRGVRMWGLVSSILEEVSGVSVGGGGDGWG